MPDNSDTRIKNKIRQCNTDRKLPLNYSAQAIQKLSTFFNCCYRVCRKTRKIAKNTRFEIPPFELSPIGHYGEKFNIGAQLHLLRYRMASKVCEKYKPCGSFGAHKHNTFGEFF